MFEREASAYRERDQPYLKWSFREFSNSSEGLCRIGRFKVMAPMMEYTEYRYMVETSNRITANDCWKALKKLVRKGARIELFQGSMPDKEFEVFLTKFNGAEIVQ